MPAAPCKKMPRIITPAYYLSLLLIATIISSGCSIADGVGHEEEHPSRHVVDANVMEEILVADGAVGDDAASNKHYHSSESKRNKIFESLKEDPDPHCPLFSTIDEKEGLEKTLNIHLVPHTHDDVGWLKTVDQYYYGLNNTIQQANVSQILDNVLHELLDPNTPHNRTFTYVETAFFSKWYTSLPTSSRASLQNLISRKQFSFANGGWCMHDEATTHYMGMIDQTTLGHSFLKNELGVIPKVGWQLDPFGHSATQGGLMTSGMGFDALYFGRIHYVDLENRRKEAQCEGIWKSSSSSSSSVFWGLSGSYRGNYGAPDGFCFDVSCADEPLVGLAEDDLMEKIGSFLMDVGVQANQTKGRQVMLTMGSDFQYSQAQKNYQNLDLLIDATHQFLSDGTFNVTDIFGERFERVRVFYSTPERYTKCKYVDLINAKEGGSTGKDDNIMDKFTLHKKELQRPNGNPKFDPRTWGVKTGDFFPYADCDHCYWTGYFSSRQSFKRLERVSSSFLHAARQIESIVTLQYPQFTSSWITKREERRKIESSGNKMRYDVKTWNSSPLYTLDSAMGVAQHHDAVAGTAKQHVAYDYAKLISDGMKDTSDFVASSLRKLLLDSSSLFAGTLENLSYCPLLNETICDVSQNATMSGEDHTIYVVVYNALASTRSEIVSIPVEHNAPYQVDQMLPRSNGFVSVDSTLIRNMNYAQVAGAADFALFFSASELPPLGVAVYRVTKAFNDLDYLNTATRITKETSNIDADDSKGKTKVSNQLRAKSGVIGMMVKERADYLVISNDVISVEFDSSTGVIKAIQDNQDGGIRLDINQNYGFYTSFGHENNQTPETRDVFGVEADGVHLHEMPWFLGSSSDGQNGGAYIFRPTTPDETLHVLPPKTTTGSVIVHESDLVTEVHAEFGDPDGQSWVKQITRILAGKDYVEVEYVVGPVPTDDGIGKEVLARYSTPIENGGEFFTDSNGREFMRRSRGDHNIFRPEDSLDIEPVASNFYPINAAISIEDDTYSLSILVDRSQAGSSLSDGSLELMIQRRLLFDDARGVGEALNETDIGVSPCPPHGDASRIGGGVIIKGIHRLKVGRGQTGANRARQDMDQIFSQPHVFVGSLPLDEKIKFREENWLGLEYPLPRNVMLITFAPLAEENSYLVRLGHQFDEGESDDLSSPVEVNLHVLFPHNKVVSVVEKTLSGNQDRQAWEDRRFQWDITSHADTDRMYAAQNDPCIVTLNPLEIRTFEIVVS